MGAWDVQGLLLFYYCKWGWQILHHHTASWTTNETVLLGVNCVEFHLTSCNIPFQFAWMWDWSWHPSWPLPYFNHGNDCRKMLVINIVIQVNFRSNGTKSSEHNNVNITYRHYIITVSHCQFVLTCWFLVRRHVLSCSFCTPMNNNSYYLELS